MSTIQIAMEPALRTQLLIAETFRAIVESTDGPGPYRLISYGDYLGYFGIFTVGDTAVESNAVIIKLSRNDEIELYLANEEIFRDTDEIDEPIEQPYEDFINRDRSLDKLMTGVGAVYLPAAAFQKAAELVVSWLIPKE